MTPLLDHAVTASFLILIASALLALGRMLRGPTLPDRIVAFDLFTALTIGILGIASIAFGKPALLDAAIVLALVSFLATVALAAYIQHHSEGARP